MRSKIADRIMNSAPADVKIFARLYSDLVVRINQILSDKEMNQKDLAEKLEKRPSEISKWLSGEHNFTLRSIAKLEAELGEPLIAIPRRNEFVSGEESSMVHLTVAAHRKFSAKELSEKEFMYSDVVKKEVQYKKAS